MRVQSVRYVSGLINDIPTGVYEGFLLIFCLGVILLLVINKDKGKKGAKQILGFLACEYALLIYCSTVVFRKTVETIGYNFTPFWSYTAIHKGRSDLIDVVVMNVVVFVPIGFLMGMAFNRIKWWMSVLIGLGVSLPIELFQFVFKRGYAEVDDVIHNTLGCLIGFMLIKMLKGIWKFCSFLFVPQWGKHPNNAGTMEPRN